MSFDQTFNSTGWAFHCELCAPSHSAPVHNGQAARGSIDLAPQANRTLGFGSSEKAQGRGGWVMVKRPPCPVDPK